jgi:hypothetical protein
MLVLVIVLVLLLLGTRMYTPAPVIGLFRAANPLVYICLVYTCFPVICTDNNHRGATEGFSCANHWKTGIHQTNVYTNGIAALEGPMTGACVYILVPNPWNILWNPTIIGIRWILITFRWLVFSEARTISLVVRHYVFAWFLMMDGFDLEFFQGGTLFVFVFVGVFIHIMYIYILTS